MVRIVVVAVVRADDVDRPAGAEPRGDVLERLARAGAASTNRSLRSCQARCAFDALAQQLGRGLDARAQRRA